jgi:UDP-3-O-[3-hydroxymyristoyl] glucosamine N-acyltransferase
VIGPLVALGEDVSVGARTVLHPGVVVNRDSSIGADCVVGPNVSVYDGVTIGDRVVINGGTVIGGLGFGFVSTREHHTRFPQVGGVIIEDDVEIGSNCCVDRASLDNTIIHRGTKLDNLVQVAHGVSIGEHTMIAAQVGISGGTSLGDWCVVGGQAGFQGHISVGDQSIVGGGSAVFSDLPEKSKVSGYPAKPHNQSLRVLALTFRLPEIMDRMRSLEIELEMMRGELQALRDQRSGSQADDLPPAGMA